MTPAPDYAAIAARVNARLAEQTKPGAIPEVVSAAYVGALLNGTACRTRCVALIREIAAELAREKGVAK